MHSREKMKTKIKICGLKSLEHIETAEKAGRKLAADQVETNLAE